MFTPSPDAVASAGSPRRGSPGRRAGALLGCLLALGLLGLAAGAAAEGKKGGWLYIHKYLSDAQRRQHGGVASAPVFVFSESGALVRSGDADGAQPLGRLIPVEAGTYYVAAGRFNLGLSRVRYTVRPGKITVVKTGFLQIETWPEAEQPQQGCSPWDAEMTLYGKKGADWVPIFSNGRSEFGTKAFGMVQMLAGTYRLGWHGFETDVEVREGQIYRVPLGTVGPLSDPKGRVGRSKEEGAANPGLRLCDDGPTHVLAGKYWVSYTKPLDVYPYEERNWQQVEVPPLNESGYDKRLPGERLNKPVLTGAEAEPQPAPVDDLDTVRGQGTAPGGGGANDPLGGDILWEAPP